MNVLKNKHLIAFIVSIVITRFIVDFSSLIILSEGRHIPDALVAFFCFLGIYNSALVLFTILSPKHKSST